MNCITERIECVSLLAEIKMPDPLGNTLSLAGYSAPEKQTSSLHVEQDDVSGAFNDDLLYSDPAQETSQYSAMKIPPIEDHSEYFPDLDDDQADPDETIPIKKGFVLQKRNQFKWLPQPYKADVWDAERLREQNGFVVDKTTKQKRPAQWEERLNFLKHKDSYSGVWNCQIPTSIHKSNEVRFVDMTFTLPSGADDVAAFVNRLESGAGSIRMNLTKSQLAPIFAGVLNFGKNDYSIIPYTIKIVELHAHLPDEFKIELTTSKVGKGTQHWIRNAGIHNRSDANSHASHCHVVNRQVHRVSSNDEVDLFVADDTVYNTGDFYRWLNANEARIRQDVEEARVKGKRDTLHIPCGPADMIRCHTILQGIVQTEHMFLHEASKKYDHPPPQIVKDEHNRDVHEVCAKAVEDFLKMTFAKIDKSQIMMRLDDVCLSLSPLRSQGNQGLSDLKRKAAAIVKNNISGRLEGCYYPSFMCRIQIGYTLCDHKNEPSGAGKSSSSNTKSHSFKSGASSFLPGL